MYEVHSQRCNPERFSIETFNTLELARERFDWLHKHSVDGHFVCFYAELWVDGRKELPKTEK